MPRYNADPIVRPSDLRGRSLHSHVAKAVRRGAARLVGFETLGDALALLEARDRTRTAYVPEPRDEPARRWTSLADVPGGMACLDEVDAYPWQGGRARGVGSRVLPEGGLIGRFPDSGPMRGTYEILGTQVRTGPRAPGSSEG